MEYQIFLQEVQKMDFIQDRETADAAVKASLGILASRLPEDEARRMTDKLPEPLSYDRLRGFQRRYMAMVSFDEYIREISAQFHLSYDQAHSLVNHVLHIAKDAMGESTLQDVESKLTSDWIDSLKAA